MFYFGTRPSILFRLRRCIFIPVVVVGRGHRGILAHHHKSLNSAADKSFMFDFSPASSVLEPRSVEQAEAKYRPLILITHRHITVVPVVLILARDEAVRAGANRVKYDNDQKRKSFHIFTALGHILHSHEPPDSTRSEEDEMASFSLLPSRERPRKSPIHIHGHQALSFGMEWPLFCRRNCTMTAY